MEIISILPQVWCIVGVIAGVFLGEWIKDERELFKDKIRIIRFIVLIILLGLVAQTNIIAGIIFGAMVLIFRNYPLFFIVSIPVFFRPSVDSLSLVLVSGMIEGITYCRKRKNLAVSVIGYLLITTLLFLFLG